MDILSIVSYVAVYLAGLISPKAWGFISLGGSVSKEIGELLTVLGNAVADKKLTAEEVSAILKEARDIPAAIAAVRNK